MRNIFINYRTDEISFELFSFRELGSIVPDSLFATKYEFINSADLKFFVVSAGRIIEFCF